MKGGRGCGGGRAGKLFIFGLFRFIFKQICFSSVVPKYIFGLFRFILKQFYLFRLFHYASETPKQTETKLSMVSKMNRNKRETDLVSVIFGLNRNFYLFVFSFEKMRFLHGSGLGCPAKPVSLRNNQKWDRNLFRHYPKQNVCFGCFASMPKQQVSVFRLNRNKKRPTETNHRQQFYQSGHIAYVLRYPSPPDPCPPPPLPPSFHYVLMYL